MKHLSLIMSMLAAFALALSGCTESETARSLNRAEAVMEEHPDSALAILGAIPSADVNSSADRALHALLLTQAQIKNGHIVDNDSLINIAVRHYSDRDDSPRLMKSLFYKAQVEYNRGDMAAAIVPAIRARELATEFDDSYWRAKAAELISDIYSVSYYFDESIRHTQEAVEHYEKAGKIRNHRFSLCDLAIERSNNGQDNNANVALIDSIYNIAQSEPADAWLTVYCIEATVPMLLRLSRYKEAAAMEEKLDSLAERYHISPVHQAYKAEIALHLGNAEMALQENIKADSVSANASDKATVYRIYSDIYMAKGLVGKAKEYTDTILSLQNRTVEELLRQSVITEEKNLYNERSRRETEKSIKTRYVAVFGGFALLAIMAVSFLIFRMRMKLKNQQIENKIQEIILLTADNGRKDSIIESLSSSLSETLSKQEDDRLKWDKMNSDRLKNESRLKAQIEDLFKEQWHFLNSLCHDYFENKDSKNSKTHITRRIEESLNILRNPENISRLQESVNNNIDGIIDKLKTQCPFLKDSDVTFLSLIFAGLAPRVICMMVDIKLKSFYNKKKRLSDRILESDAQDKVWFILKMS